MARGGARRCHRDETVNMAAWSTKSGSYPDNYRMDVNLL